MYIYKWILGLVLFSLSLTVSAPAWNYYGHRCVTEVALAALPDDFPAFARLEAAGLRIPFLSGEPDRWRNLRDPALRHINEPDHYFDFEALNLYGLNSSNVPALRNDLLGKIYVERARHPDKFPAEEKVDPTSVQLLFGLLPYAIHENFLKLKSSFSTLRFMNYIGASPDDIYQAEQNVLHVMGIMSHFVGDGAQPLHVSIHHHGWVGENPEKYTTSHRFHSWIDGGFIAVAGINMDGLKGRVVPAVSIWPGDVIVPEANAFPVIMEYLVESHRRVVPLYKLQKEKKLEELEPSPEGRQFIEEQLLRGGQFLGNLYYSAYLGAQTSVLPPHLAKPVPVAP